MRKNLEGWLVSDILGNSLLERDLLRLPFQQDKFHLDQRVIPHDIRTRPG